MGRRLCLYLLMKKRGNVPLCDKNVQETLNIKLSQNKGARALNHCFTNKGFLSVPT